MERLFVPRRTALRFTDFFGIPVVSPRVVFPLFYGWVVSPLEGKSLDGWMDGGWMAGWVACKRMIQLISQ